LLSKWVDRIDSNTQISTARPAELEREERNHRGDMNDDAEKVCPECGGEQEP
jgi:hypothetical protein